MDLQKLAFITLPVLISLNYLDKIGEIIFAVNTNLERWGRILILLIQGKRHFFRYKSKIWFNIEKKYNATKREYCGILKVLKKVRY